MTPGMTIVTAVVPTKDSGRTIAACLESLRRQTQPGVQIVVVDNASTDDTVELARSRADVVIHGGPERSAQRNHGWLSTADPYVVFVDSDMVLEPDVLRHAVDQLASAPAMGGVVIPEHAFGVGFFSRCRALEKALYLGDERVEALRVVRREVLHEVGGFDESLTAFEDWELHDRITHAGYGIGRTAAAIWHDEGRITLGTLFAKKRYYGRWLPTAHASGKLSRPLARRFFVKRPALLFRTPHRTAGLALLKTVELAGIVFGAADARRQRAS